MDFLELKCCPSCIIIASSGGEEEENGRGFL